MDKELILTDYKKWLLYSFDNQNFDNYYSLFKALQTGETFGTVQISKSEIQGDSAFILSVENIDDKLQITYEQKDKLLRYLIDNYFHSEDIDAVMKEKKRQSDIAINHNFIESKNTIHTNENVNFKVKPHPKETFYFNIKLVVSIFFYVILVASAVWGIMSDLSLVFSILIVLFLMTFVVIINKIVTGLFIGMIRGSSIRITKDQFPEIYKIIEDQAQILKIELPEIYITSGHFNAFVTRFSRAHILMLYSEVIETALQGNYDVLKYVTAHELCHIKQKHLAKRNYLFPARIIPFLSLAYSRACEYTCDRVGYHFSPKGAIEGILIMTTGKEIHSKFNIELHIKNSDETQGVWTWLSEKFLTHPHLYKRLIAIKEFSRYN